MGGNSTKPILRALQAGNIVAFGLFGAASFFPVITILGNSLVFTVHLVLFALCLLSGAGGKAHQEGCKCEDHDGGLGIMDKSKAKNT